MTVLAFTSVKGAPGVTTTLLGLGCVWPRRCLLIEADPSGGLLLSDLGFDRPAGVGLLEAALAGRRGSADLLASTLSLTADERIRLLPGLTEPAHLAAVTDQWTSLAHAISDLAAAGELDVLIDCGRLHAGTPWPLLAAADAISMLLRPEAGEVALLNGWLPILGHRLSTSTQTLPQLGVLAVGNHPYRAPELAEGLAAPLVWTITHDPVSALRLRTGERRLNARSGLLRSLTGLVPQLMELAARTDAVWLTGQRADALVVSR